MKKFLGAAIALVLLLVLAVPALAADVDTGVTVTQGGGNLPVVKCKWETPDNSSTPYTQVMPPCTYQGTKTVTIWVVVGDVEDNGVVAQVVADIFHPETLPECGSLKYGNVSLVMVDRLSAGIPAFDAANTANLIHYASGHTYATVREQLVENVAQVWKCDIILDYHQPAGDYRVEVIAIDTHSNVSSPMVNTFLYIPTACIEIDFTSVTYPDALLSSHVWALGDTNFGTADKPTVRNVGNTNVQIRVWQDDMDFGQYDNGGYKVEFDSRLGPDTGSNTVIFDPYQTVTLPGILPLCNTMKLDFSIHIKFATPGIYSGDMVISCIAVPFGDCPD